MPKHPAINIFSGESGLGAALTNPTVLGKLKQTTKSYPVVYLNRRYPDAEAAYQQNKSGDVAQDDNMMAEVICLKFKQHPDLAEAVRARGGADWLATCTHFTNARSDSAQRWEGAGMESRFIRNLVEGWTRFLEDKSTQANQHPLF